MRHLLHALPLMAILALPVAGQSGGRAAPVLPGPANKADPSTLKHDTTLVYHFRTEDSVQVRLWAGFIYKATLDGADWQLIVKPADPSVRDVLIADVSNQGSTNLESRFNIQARQDGVFIISVTGAEPGRDITLRLTGPPPSRAKPTSKPGGSGGPYSP